MKKGSLFFVLLLCFSSSVFADTQNLRETEEKRIRKIYSGIVKKAKPPEFIELLFIESKRINDNCGMAAFDYRSERSGVGVGPFICVNLFWARKVSDSALSFALAHELGHYFDIDLLLWNYSVFDNNDIPELRADAFVLYLFGEKEYRKRRFEVTWSKVYWSEPEKLSVGYISKMVSDHIALVKPKLPLVISDVARRRQFAERYSGKGI